MSLNFIDLVNAPGRGERDRRSHNNGFNGAAHVVQTVETVPLSANRCDTPLKRGVNNNADRGASRFAARTRFAVRVLGLGLLWLLCAEWAASAELMPVDAFGLRVARGFRVTQYAD